MVLDWFRVYSFIKRLVTPFSDWPACRLGIIDDSGTILKKRSELNTRAEQDAFGVYDVMMLNLKKTLAKVPGGGTKLGSYAAALYLIKEYHSFTETALLLTEDMSDFSIAVIAEEIAANCVSGGQIAGLGVGPQGEPGKKRTKKSFRAILDDMEGRS